MASGFGSHIARQRMARAGGPWLALVNAGHSIRVNTPAEAYAVLAAAKAG